MQHFVPRRRVEDGLLKGCLETARFRVSLLR